MENYTLSEPQKPPEPASPIQASDLRKKYTKPLIIGGVIVGFLIMFMLGSLLGSSRNTARQVAVISPTATKAPIRTTPKPSEIPSEVNSSMQYLPGKQYLDDSIAIITKNEPKRALLIAISRFELSKNYTQYARVNYYNGTDWVRETITTTTPNAQIVINPLLSRWSTVRPVFNRDQNTLEVTMQNKPVTFTFTSLSPDIAQKTLPGLTKFTALGTGSLRNGDEVSDAYISYTSSYSRSAADMAFLGNPERVSSLWTVMWDASGSAYMADSFSSDTAREFNGDFGVILHPNATYQLSTVSFRRLQQPDQYNISFSGTTPLQVQFALTSPLIKANAKTYLWRSALTSGKAVQDKKEIPVVGLFEGIEQLSR